MPKEKWLINESELDDFQYSIRQLNTERSYTVSGCAGSGKTILALWRARELKDMGREDYYVIVYTKALRDFIRAGIREIGLNPDRVVYEWDWEHRKNSPSSDYIIVDEAQDFSESEILNFNKKAKKSIMFFGDTAQQLYSDKTIYSGDIPHQEPTISMAKISDLLRLPPRELTFNYRLPKKIARFAEYLMTFPDEITLRCKKEGNFLPVIKKCLDRKKELDYIIDIINKHGFEDIGILVPTQKDVKYVYDYLNRLDMNPEAKYSLFSDFVMSLDFDTTNPKIMTYHSSKGLQFGTVFLPFCESHKSFFQNPLYVAVTRTSDRLYITYSGILSSFFDNIPKELYKKIDLNYKLAKDNKKILPF
jgi:superfamily I DNA/RNA helicase